MRKKVLMMLLKQFDYPLTSLEKELSILSLVSLRFSLSLPAVLELVLFSFSLNNLDNDGFSIMFSVPFERSLCLFVAISFTRPILDCFCFVDLEVDG